MKYGVTLVLFLSLLRVSTVQSQTRFSDNLFIKGAYRTGVVLPEYSLFTYLVNDDIRSVQLSLSKRSAGLNGWAQLYHYPEYGMAVQYSTLGNREVFGEAISLFPFVGIPWINGKKFSCWNQLGLGLGYTTKKFEPESNPTNVAIGSHINLHFNFELNLQYQPTDRWALYTGVAFDHLSNGNTGEPNLGINTMAFNAGIRHRSGAYIEPTNHTLEKHKPSSRIAVIGATGIKHARSLQSKAYPVASLSLEYKWKLFRVFYPGIGADILYDGSTKEEVRAFGPATYHGIDDYKTGFHLSQELVFHKFSIALQEGWYVGLKDKAFSNATYHRFILRHQVGDRWLVSVAMKAHVVVLDYVECGVGYLIKP